MQRFYRILQPQKAREALGYGNGLKAEEKSDCTSFPYFPLNCLYLKPKNLGSRSLIPSQDQHAVTVAEEAVLLFDRLSVGLKDQLTPSQSTDEHEKRRFREVEVRE